MGEVGNEKQAATKICTECGLSVKGEAAVCEHCGNVFRKLPNGNSKEVSRDST